MIGLIIIVILLIACLVYVKFPSCEQYWKKKKVFYVKPRWWQFFQFFAIKKSIFDIINDVYVDYPNRRYYGAFAFTRSSLIVMDPDLIKQITAKDFDHFPDRDKIVQKTNDPFIDLNLLALEGEKWKNMRSTLSPAFTSSKMKAMFVLMEEAANNYTNYFYNQKTDGIIELNMKNTFIKYTVDMIATCVFGFQCNSLENDQNEFFQKGVTFSIPTRARMLRSLLFLVFPKIYMFFKLPLFPRDVSDFFKKMVIETMAVRERNGTVRPDMIHLLMKSRKRRLKHENNEDVNEQDTGCATVEESAIGTSQRKLEFTDDMIAAQVIIFFLAGFDTTSTVLSFLSYHLAVDPAVQNKVYQEIKEALNSEKNAKITYDTLLKMKYLDQVVSETLRMYPPGFVLNRVCIKDYLIKAQNSDEVDFVVDKGCSVTIPVISIHRDPKYFPDPEKFDPDRFSDENKGKIVPGSYLPFGSGPRNCIGLRFALLESKALIVSLLNKFEIVPIKKTVIPMKFAKTPNLHIEGGFWLGLKKRETFVNL